MRTEIADTVWPMTIVCHTSTQFTQKKKGIKITCNFLDPPPEILLFLVGVVGRGGF